MKKYVMPPGFTNREYQIEHLNSPPKTKDDELVQKDNRIASLVNKHKENEIGLGELLTEYMLTRLRKSACGRFSPFVKRKKILKV
jgi:hypothetical protein